MRKPIFRIDKLREVEFKHASEMNFENVKVVNGDISESSVDVFSTESSLLENVIFNSAVLEEFSVSDSIFDMCSFAGTKCVQGYLSRCELLSSRLQGMQLSESTLRDVAIVKSKCSLANFRFSSLKDVVFKDCDLKESDFVGAKLESVYFINCDLSDSDFFQSKLKNVTLKGSIISNIHINKDSFEQVTVDSGQAIYFVSLFGLNIED